MRTTTTRSIESADRLSGCRSNHAFGVTCKTLIRLIAIFAGGMVGAAGGAAAEPARPNVVFIVADDLGWSDTTLYGTTTFYSTPNIERLRKRGMLFRNAYTASPLCSPTRASLLTGLYPGRIGITQPQGHLPEVLLKAGETTREPPERPSLQAISATRLAPEYFTLAEALSAAGYRTAHFGKWHLGNEPYDPLHQGFELDIPHEPGIPSPLGSYLAPWKFVHQQQFQGRPGENIEDALSEAAARFIRENRQRPFFVNYWAYSVHGPWTATPRLVEEFERASRPDSPQRNAVYAAMVRTLDDAVGRLLDAIDDAKIAERTIVVFYSDNGAWVWEPRQTNAPASAHVPVTSNLPLRGGKGTLYDGGTRVPCVVIWPGKTRPGATSDALFSSVDFFPTILQMCGIRPRAALKIDGISQEPTLREGGSPRSEVYCYFPHYGPHSGPGAWVRRDDWKLIRFFHAGEGQSERFELYNLKDDVGESIDLASQRVELVRELDGLIVKHLRDIGAKVPGKNPDYNPDLAAAAAFGWRPGNRTRLSIHAGVLLVQAQMNGPQLLANFPPLSAGPFALEFRCRSTGKGRAHVFWKEQGDAPPFHRDRSAALEMQHDGKLHDYRVEFQTAKPLMAVRLDPSEGPAEIGIERVRLKNAAGKIVRDWDFQSPPSDGSGGHNEE